MGLEMDESDEVLSDQHPCPGNWAVQAIVLALQCRRPCLWVVGIDTGKDCRITAGSAGIRA